MKKFSDQLMNFLMSDQVESFYIADLFEIETTLGLRMYATDGQIPIAYNGNVYEPVKYGIWRRGSVSTKLGMTSSNMSFTVMTDGTPMQGEVLKWPDGTTRSNSLEFTTDSGTYSGTLLPGITGADYFYARISGIIQPVKTVNYTFSLQADDGAAVYLNGEKILDNKNIDNIKAPVTADIPMVAYGIYNLTVVLNNDGLAVSGVQLTWKPAGGTESVVASASGTYFTCKTWKMAGPSTNPGSGPSYPTNGKEVTVPNEYDISLMQAIQIGLFDGAKISVYTTYMPDYGDLVYGVEVKYSGQITELDKTGRTTAEGTAESYMFKLNQQMPRLLMQPSCRWVFGDAGCTLDLNSYAQSGVVGSGTTSLQITPQSALPQADGYFAQGVVTMTSGQNMSMSMSVKQHKGGVLTLTKPFLFPLKEGDSFQVVAGCDHTYASCQQKFNNIANFGGMPWIPNYERSI